MKKNSEQVETPERPGNTSFIFITLGIIVIVSILAPSISHQSSVTKAQENTEKKITSSDHRTEYKINSHLLFFCDPNGKSLTSLEITFGAPTALDHNSVNDFGKVLVNMGQLPKGYEGNIEHRSYSTAGICDQQVYRIRQK